MASNTVCVASSNSTHIQQSRTDIIDPWFTMVQSETRGFINILCLRPHWHGKVSVNYAKVTESRLFASPALCHFRKTRTQYVSGRTENNRRTLVGLVCFRAGMKHKSFRICTQYHSMATCQPHSHLWHRFFCYFPCRPVRTLRLYFLPRLIPNVSFYLQSLPPFSAATVHSITSRAAWVLRHCLGPHKGSTERGFGCSQQIKASLWSGSAQFERLIDIQRGENCSMASRSFCSRIAFKMPH